MNTIMKNIKFIKYIIISVYFGIIIGVEFAYRQTLFDKSVNIESNWQKNSTSATINFFKVITHFGSIAVILPLTFIIFFFFSLNKSYTFISVLVMSLYFDNLLKIIYNNPRPFWLKKDLFTSCETGFGNPSGHAFSSSAVYLSFWYMVTDFDTFKKTKKGIIFRIFLLVFFLLLIFTILLSRLYLGVHSINQIIYGSLLGTGVYAFYFFVLDLYTNDKFVEFIINKINIIFHSILFTVFFIVGLVCYLAINRENNYYKEVLMSICPDTKLYRFFEDEGFYAMLVLFFLIGIHYGYLVLFIIMKKYYPGKEKHVINWWKNDTIPKFLLRILMLIPFLLGMILFLVVPTSNYDLIAVIFTFKFAFPYLLTGLLMGSAYFISCIKLNLIVLVGNNKKFEEESNVAAQKNTSGNEIINLNKQMQSNENVIININK